MKVSIVTICYNAESTISDTIQSVLDQDYPNIEYIIIDGASKDKTLEIVKSFDSDKIHLTSEPDKGLYDALNKGFMKANGDIIACLHADDKYAHPKVISDIVNQFVNQQVEAVSSSVHIFKDNQFDKPFRKYKANAFNSTPWSKHFKDLILTHKSTVTITLANYTPDEIDKMLSVALNLKSVPLEISQVVQDFSGMCDCKCRSLSIVYQRYTLCIMFVS